MWVVVSLQRDADARTVGLGGLRSEVDARSLPLQVHRPPRCCGASVGPCPPQACPHTQHRCTWSPAPSLPAWVGPGTSHCHRLPGENHTVPRSGEGSACSVPHPGVGRQEVGSVSLTPCWVDGPPPTHAEEEEAGFDFPCLLDVLLQYLNSENLNGDPP